MYEDYSIFGFGYAELSAHVKEILLAVSENYRKYNQIDFDSLDEFWSCISPTNELKEKPFKFIYRGQRNASWGLMPNILRQGDTNPAHKIWWKEAAINSDYQVFSELMILEHFVNHCDHMGLKIINDSVKLRNKYLNTNSANNYYLNPSEWPNEEILEVMALAQHHGVPTRLLDWSKRSFVAAYFSASSALENRSKWQPDDRLAVWALDIELIHLYQNIDIVKIPGSASTNLAAQAGLFSLHKQAGVRGEVFVPVSMECEFGNLPNSPLYKITLPVSRAKDLLGICEKFGVMASTLFPGFDGAARAVSDSINCSGIDNDRITSK